MSRRRGAALVALFLVGLAACGGAPSRAAPPPTLAERPQPKAAPAPRAPEDPFDALPSFDALTSRGASVAPGMASGARGQVSIEADAPVALEVLRPETTDACARVLFVASAPVRARLVDDAGETLGALDTPAESGALGPRGPGCVRRGAALRVEITRAAPGTVRVRWTSWRSPPSSP